ncbi:MAG TPA: hypothetical protein VF552_06615, partial [Allosphingosinicella sp.]
MTKSGRVAIGATLLAAACACSGGPAERRPPAFDQSFRPRTPTDGRSPDWPEALRSDCRWPPADPTRPVLCLGTPAAGAVQKGHPIAIDIEWRNAPPGSGLVVYLERDDPDREARYFGFVGPLVLVPIETGENGRSRFEWNGRELPCAPTDAPRLCEGTAEIGRYRLRAALYDGARFSTVGRPAPNGPSLVVHDVSEPFVVQGAPDLRPIGRTLWWAALNHAMSERMIRASSALAGDTNGSGVEVFAGPDGGFCAAIQARPPHRGSLKACLPLSSVVGEAGLLNAGPAGA